MAEIHACMAGIKRGPEKPRIRATPLNQVTFWIRRSCPCLPTFGSID